MTKQFYFWIFIQKKSGGSQTYQHSHVHWSITHNSQGVDTTLNIHQQVNG